jgi:hypothetical protein
MSVVRKRRDFGVCEYICHNIACDSYAEVLFLLHLLADAAEPCLVAPARLGRTPRPIVDPEQRREVDVRPHACLHLRGAFYFFQVSFSTPDILTVDALCWDRGWTAIEIDGEGHESKFDAKRPFALGLPVQRISPSNLLDKEFKAA